MENPYQPIGQITGPPPLAFSWERIVAWSLFIFVVANVIGFVSGLTMARWQIYGSTLEQAVQNARRVRQITYVIVGAILYWRLAAPVQERLFHVAAAFVTVALIDLTVSFFVFKIPVGELIDLWGLGRSLLAAAIGLGLASRGSRRSW